MNLEAYAPAVSLLLLGVMAIVAFVRVRSLIKRHGIEGRVPTQQPVAHAEPPAPWWASHLDDYTREPSPKAAVSEERVRAEEPPAPEEPHGSAELEERDVTPDTGEYVMLAQVELWFGDYRVAVRSGSDTDRRFRRFAEVLLEDLGSTRVRE